MYKLECIYKNTGNGKYYIKNCQVAYCILQYSVYIYEFDTLCGIAFNLGFHTFYNTAHCAGDYHIESIELLLLVINNPDLSSEIIQTSYIGKY